MTRIREEEEWQTNTKSYMIYQMNDPLVSRARHYLTLNISETVQERHSYNEILIGTYRTELWCNFK